MKVSRYKQIHQILKSQIQQGEYQVGDSLPSENELCREFSITRTTARSALNELIKEGFIDRKRGKRSIVKERRKSLGLLAIKGFSEAAGGHVETVMLTPPVISSWPGNIEFDVSEAELEKPCIYFRRLRKIDNQPVMHESNWFSCIGFDDFMDQTFIEGSFFKTLSRRYLIEIIGSSQELYAITADKEIAGYLEITPGNPVLRICIRFTTSRPNLNIYSRLFCNTEAYAIGNTYKL